ncbi:hypothetical protein V8B55DRAFT_1464183 [Mucor lusitanicus]
MTGGHNVWVAHIRRSLRWQLVVLPRTWWSLRNHLDGPYPFIIPAKEIKNVVFPIVQTMGSDVHVDTVQLANGGV